MPLRHILRKEHYLNFGAPWGLDWTKIPHLQLDHKTN